MDPATGNTPAGASDGVAADAGDAGGTTDAAPEAEVTEGAPEVGEATETTTAEPAEAEPKTEPPKATEPEPPKAARKPDLTGRLAALSREKRETERRARDEAKARATLEAEVGPIRELRARAQKGDQQAIRQLIEEFGGLDFQKVVNVYAETPAVEPTPEEKHAAELKAIQGKIDALEKAEQQKALRVQQENETRVRAATIASIEQRISAKATDHEISARLGNEAAEAVFAEVLSAFEAAGRPQLMPGEFEEAVDAAMNVVELRYEERGKRLVKTRVAAAVANGTANGAGNGKPNGAAKTPAKAPADAQLSEKDEEILAGLLDKTAPATRKPRQINSSLGGSAPAKTQARGGMDARDALRDVLANIR